jgi:hypothetical protein
VIGDNHKGETLYRWDNPSGDGYVWKGFGDKETHPKYTGDVKNGKPNGLGVMISPSGSKCVGSWKNGEKYGHGTFTYSDEGKYVGEWKDDLPWKGITYDYEGKIYGKYVNGKYIKQ